MNRFSSSQIILHVSAGGLTACFFLLADAILHQSRHWGTLEIVGLAAGILIAGAGFFPRSGMVPRLTGNISLSLLSFFVFLALGEGMFRMIRFDFSGVWQGRLKIPPCFLQPTVPQGTVYYRRFGPMSWTGQVLKTGLEEKRVYEHPHGNEPVITVEYDRNGFRNPEGMEDGGVAVAGDSFTELGYLPYEDLFTTVIARKLDVPVLNLGASSVGPLSALSYLQEYGVSESTKHAIIMFFEGNDMGDLSDEGKALAHWEKTGRRPYREIPRQTSLVKALYRRLGLEVIPPPRKRHHRRKVKLYQAQFKTPKKDIPVYVHHIPPSRADFSRGDVRRLNYFMKEYAAFGKEHQIKVWLGYLPSKLRVFHGLLEFPDGTPPQYTDWRPTDLPDAISELCGQYGIAFIDLTPALVRETVENYQPMFNVIDTHLNARGSALVGEELARRLSEDSVTP